MMLMKCEICNRDIEKSQITRHHQPPKKITKRHMRLPKLMYLCNDCHKTVHSYFKLKELARMSYMDLKDHEKIKNFAEWVKNRPVGIVTHARRNWKGGKYE